MRKYDLTVNNNNYEVIVKEVTDKIARMEVNGVEHTVAINEIQTLVLPVTIPKAVASAQSYKLSVPHGGSGVGGGRQGGVIAPMPGQIKAILVREGDRVHAGQKLLIMEAMKLENKIPANRDGIVKQIMVRDGDIVSQGQELVVIE